MHGNAKIPVFFSALLCWFLMSCATTTAPHGWLSPAEEMQTSSYGGWISVTLSAPKNKAVRPIHGELIAVHEDTLYVLANRLYAIPVNLISKAKLTAYNARAMNLAGTTLLMTLATVSHGVLLILSAPAWILTGTLATIHQSKIPELKYPGKVSLEELKKYARFPQGLPRGLALNSLKPKPFRKK